MKVKQILFFTSFVGVMVLSACSSDDDIENNAPIELSDNNFSFSAEDYDTDTPLSRSERPVQSKTVDLGDDLEAEISVEQDAQIPQTRATKTISDGHYTIYAIDEATGTRVTGANSKLAGTLSSGKFIHDAGSKLKLNAGTYTFVCFNDAVVDNGTKLTVSNGNDALIGVKQHETISGTAWRVHFDMKRQNARVRFRIIGYSDKAVGINGNMESTTAQPVSIDYSLDAQTLTPINGSFSDSYTLPATSNTYNAKYVQAHDFVTNYTYVVPGISAGDMTFKFNGGTFYGTSLAGKALSLSHLGTLQFMRNHSYTVNIKLKGVLYLYEDGTVWTLNEHPSHTPIGVVAREKTNTEKGIAAGLEVLYDKDNSPYGPAGYQFTGSGINLNSTAINTTYYTTIWDARNDMDGYKWTWDAAGSKDGLVKANEKEKYPLFYAAGHYTPTGVTITGSNIGKWYVPTMGEFVQLYKMFGASSIQDNSVSQPVWQVNSGLTYAQQLKISDAFNNVGFSFNYTFDNCFFVTSSNRFHSGSGRRGLIITSAQAGFATAGGALTNIYLLPFVGF